MIRIIFLLFLFGCGTVDEVKEEIQRAICPDPPDQAEKYGWTFNKDECRDEEDERCCDYTREDNKCWGTICSADCIDWELVSWECKE